MSKRLALFLMSMDVGNEIQRVFVKVEDLLWTRKFIGSNIVNGCSC